MFYFLDSHVGFLIQEYKRFFWVLALLYRGETPQEPASGYQLGLDFLWPVIGRTDATIASAISSSTVKMSLTSRS